MQQQSSAAVKAKAKVPKVPKGNPNKHQQARISFLYQAATYLANTQRDQKLQNRSGEGISTDHLSLGQTGSAELSTTSQSGDGMEVGSENLQSQDIPISTSGTSAAVRSTILGLSRYLSSHLRAVSLKSQVRLSRDIKRSICKRCSTPLVPDITSQSTTENRSCGGKKPWADVLVVQCSFCKAEKRLPVGSKRQARKGERADNKTAALKKKKRKEKVGSDIVKQKPAGSGNMVPLSHPQTPSDVR